MHLWRTASQQVNEGRVEGHDGISQVYPVLLMLLLSPKPTRNKQLSIPLLNNTGGHNACFVRYHQKAFKTELRALT